MKLGIDDAAVGISEEGGPYPPYIIEDALLPEAVLKVKSQKRVYPSLLVTARLMHIQCKSESFQENLQAAYGYIRKKEEIGSHEKAAHDANVRRTTEKEGIG